MNTGSELTGPVHHHDGICSHRERPFQHSQGPVPPPFVVPMTRTRCLARREGTKVERCSSRARDADWRPTFLELKMLAATEKEASVREQEPQH